MHLTIGWAKLAFTLSAGLMHFLGRLFSSAFSLAFSCCSCSLAWRVSCEESMSSQMSHSFELELYIINTISVLCVWLK